jgi:prepilin-type N-terminal cleavage/methylation domain-containing protein
MSPCELVNLVFKKRGIRMRRKEGFTLIELMIVIAIIAIIAAIAIPSLLRARISGNESSAVGTLRSFTSNQAVWRQGDTDRNGIGDYWTGDISGFYRTQKMDGNPIAMFDTAIARSEPIANRTGEAAAYVTPANAQGVNPADLAALAGEGSKSGYWITAMTLDGNAAAYRIDTYGGGAQGALYNTGRYAACAYPDAYDSTGRNIFIVDEAGTIYSQDAGNANPVLNWPGYPPPPNIWRVVQ